MKAPYGKFKGKTIFEAAKTCQSRRAQKRSAICPPTKNGPRPTVTKIIRPARKRRKGYLPGGEALPQHKTWFFYLARICNHCSYPACLAACPRNAIYKRPEDGIVLIDQERCRGYRKCMEACPYKKTLYRGTTRYQRKVHRLFPARRRPGPAGGGLPMQTRCMAACIGHIRLQGLVN